MSADIRYPRAHGETSATYRPGSTPPDLEFPSGTTVGYLATGATTDGLFGLYRWAMSAARGGARPHVHRTFAESFFVLAGSIQVYDGHRWLDTTAGDFVHVPAGAVHGFRNESGEPAAMLIHFAPGVPREAYFEGLAEHARTGPPPEPELAEFFRTHDNVWVEEVP
jgi:mannose-6-phosphate isomerase-like protein (cupin superfamily)